MADDSLFGARGRPGKSVKAHEIPANSVIVSRGEVDRLKGSAIVRSAQDELAERAAKEADLEIKQKAARDRKARMLKLEEDAKKKAKKSELEVCATGLRTTPAVFHIAGEEAPRVAGAWPF